MYAANHYVRVKGHMYVAGELLPEDVEEEKIAWLLEKGAIREVAPKPGPAQIPPVFEKPDVVEEAPEEGSPEEPADEEVEAEEPVNELPADIVEEEAPEIDVMEGVVTPEPTKEKAKRPARQRSGAKGGSSK